MTAIEVTEPELQRCRVSSEIKLTSSTFDIRRKIRALVGNDQGLEKHIYDILADSLSVQDALRDRLGRVLSARYGSEFALIFSSYVSAEMGLDRIVTMNGGEDTKTKGFDFFENNHIDFQQLYPKPINDMLLVLSEAFEFPSRNGLFGIVEDYFEWVKRESLLAKENQKYTSFIATIQKDGIVVGNVGFKNFDVMSQTAIRGDKKALDWDYLGGYEDVKDYFKDVTVLINGIDHCDTCKDYMPLNERLVKGTIIVGPPNTGKTTIIEIFCNQANIPYDQFSVGDVGSKFVYQITKNIKARCEGGARQVRQGITPVFLIYIMEIDALGKERYTQSGSDEGDKAVAELCVHMRGPKAVPGVIFVADTNRPDVLDTALLSAGRFTRILHMGHPDAAGVEKILRALVNRGEEYCNNGNIFAQIDYQKLTRLCDNTPYLDNTVYHAMVQRSVVGGYTGGDLEEIIVNAKRRKLLAHLKEGAELTPITTDDLLGEVKMYDMVRK